MARKEKETPFKKTFGAFGGGMEGVVVLCVPCLRCWFLVQFGGPLFLHRGLMMSCW